MYEPYKDKVLCGDCLRVKDFTNDRHNGTELCECGGEFCGCEDCTASINALVSGKKKAEEVGCRMDIDYWNDVDGINAGR
jgi:hypothetical protein